MEADNVRMYTGYLLMSDVEHVDVAIDTPTLLSFSRDTLVNNILVREESSKLIFNAIMGEYEQHFCLPQLAIRVSEFEPITPSDNWVSLLSNMSCTTKPTDIIIMSKDVTHSCETVFSVDMLRRILYLETLTKTSVPVIYNKVIHSNLNKYIKLNPNVTKISFEVLRSILKV